MTRSLPEPRPDLSSRPGAEASEPCGKTKVHAAADATLDPLICRKFTGEVTFRITMNEGGVRAVKITTEETYRPKT